MNRIRKQVATVRSRQQRLWMLQSISLGLVVSGLLACVIAALIFSGVVGTTAWPWAIAVLIAGPLFGLAWSTIFSRPMHRAAMTIDRACGLKDRVSTAWSFLSKSDRSALQDLQIEDTDTRMDSVDPKSVAPYATPRLLPVGTVLSFAAVMMIIFSSNPASSNAALEVNDAVASQADRIAEELKELEEFNEEDKNEDIEQLLKELAEKLEELKEPGMDPREAMATLSEMQMALEQQQQALMDPNMDSQLQNVGEALSLSESMQQAGQSLANGEFEKAAQELEKQEMPELDRQTEKALLEKLEKIRQDASNGSAKKLQEAVAQISTGMSEGNQSAFQEGMQGLAGESRKVSRRKKLSDLLRKQCQCLSECKGECEGLCQNPGSSNKPGGTKAGLASSGNEPGDKTPMLSTNEMMQITGQESAQGDVDIETLASEEEQQEAIREYKEKVEKFEQLSESVLDSEPIPLGHRQTIRRYFDSIRPSSSETDQVKQKTSEPTNSK